MKLLTAEVREKLPPLYSQEDNADPLVVLHYFNPMGTGDWYIIEGSPEGEDFLFFGLCDLGFPELGYVTLYELESVDMGLGMGIERDAWWTPKRLSEVQKKVEAR